MSVDGEGEEDKEALRKRRGGKGEGWQETLRRVGTWMTGEEKSSEGSGCFSLQPAQQGTSLGVHVCLCGRLTAAEP